MQPTKLPDDLFPAEDRHWQEADYPARVALLVLRFKAVARVYEARDDLGAKALAERDALVAELAAAREVNAQLVLDLEANAAENVQYANEAMELRARSAEMAYTIQQLTTGQKGPGK